jgi:asparagine synthase (glutamine-hydrolysing)
VIVHAYEEWGQDCVKQLRGMFAFVIWDQNKQELFAARDRLGIKPFYYYLDTRKFIFGSEIKSILKHKDVKRNICSQSLYDYFTLMYIPAPNTIFDGIYKLLPGHTLTLKAGKIKISEYWDIDFSRTEILSEQEWCERIIEKLTESIKLRMISDVPLGAFLSGGIDSSAVVALMAKLQHDPVKTASIGFEEKQFNETSFARSIAQRYSTEHYEKIVTPDALDILDKLVWFFDEPFADSSAIPTYYVSKIARQKVTVALSGDGGDENFAGYRRYLFDHLENRIRGFIPGFIRKNLIATAAKMYPKADNLPQFLRAKTLLTNISRDPVEGYYNSMTWFQNTGNILSKAVRNQIDDYTPLSHFKKYFEKSRTDDPLSKIQYLDMKTYLVDDILTKVDRTSMANSLEVRVPLLDHEFMELVALIPSKLKLKKNEGKHILKKSLIEYLPDATLYRKKMGFSIPLAMWLRNELNPVFKDRVFAPNSFSNSFLNMDNVKRIWKKHASGSFDFSFELWSILILETWGRKWQ